MTIEVDNQDQRWACNKHLRHAIHPFSEQSLSRCVWAEIYYQHHRQKNQSHANALRRSPLAQNHLQKCGSIDMLEGNRKSSINACQELTQTRLVTLAPARIEQNGLEWHPA